MAKNPLVDAAEVLTQALPYIRQYRTRTMVVKIGGSMMDDGALLKGVLQDILWMKWTGIKPVLVHGGGKHISQLLARLQIEAKFAEGLRVTDAPTMEVTQMVLSGLINKDLVSTLAGEGGRAVGISGRDGGLLRAKRLEHATIDYGFVGDITGVDPSILHTLDQSDFIPVVSPIASGPDGESLNINADVAATEIAVALGAEKLLFITDVNGVLRDVKDPESTISEISLADLPQLEKDGILSGGMIPKVRSSGAALSRGIRNIHILGGKVGHALLLELFTRSGVGTKLSP